MRRPVPLLLLFFRLSVSPAESRSATLSCSLLLGRILRAFPSTTVSADAAIKCASDGGRDSRPPSIITS